MRNSSPSTSPGPAIGKIVDSFDQRLRTIEEKLDTVSTMLGSRPSPLREALAAKLLLTPDEAARTLSISRKTLWSMSVPRGTIPVVHLGRSVRYSVVSLQEWIAERQVIAQ